MPRIEQSFEVPTAPDRVWQFFQDVPQVVECMPGVELDRVQDEGRFAGRMNVKLGPMNAQFQGEAAIENLEAGSRTGSIAARGVDKKGGSRASARVRYEINETPSGTRVSLAADITLQGAMAQFGRTGLIEEVSGHLTREFAGCIEKKLSAESPEDAAGVRAAEVRGFRLLLMSLWAWLRRAWSREGRS
ncbi:MAG: SRPBCC family protein [Actinomycetota bacterium]